MSKLLCVKTRFSVNQCLLYAACEHRFGKLSEVDRAMKHALSDSNVEAVTNVSLLILLSSMYLHQIKLN